MVWPSPLWDVYSQNYCGRSDNPLHFTINFFTPLRLICPPTHIKITLYGVSSSYEFHMSIRLHVMSWILHG